jgi:indoleamine 2,3-dioxygenase
VLSYASYALDNWRRLDPAKPVRLDNIVLLQNFLGGLDEEWFVVVHIQIEREAGPGLAGLARALNGAFADKEDEALLGLASLARAQEAMRDTLLRMKERCDPYVYYTRVRPYIHGWKNNPALPNGLGYEEVAAYEGRP